MLFDSCSARTHVRCTYVVPYHVIHCSRNLMHSSYKLYGARSARSNARYVEHFCIGGFAENIVECRRLVWNTHISSIYCESTLHPIHRPNTHTLDHAKMHEKGDEKHPNRCNRVSECECVDWTGKWIRASLASLRFSVDTCVVKCRKRIRFSSSSISARNIPNIAISSAGEAAFVTPVAAATATPREIAIC